MSIVPYDPTEQGRRIACAQAGCRRCLEELLLEHKGLIYVVLRRQYAGKCDYVDLIQEGWIGLWQAILKYDPERGSAFSTYAGRAIRNRIWNAVERGWKAEGWIEAGRGEDTLSAIISNWQEEQVRQAVQEGLACLPERLRQVIRQVYGLEGGTPMSLVEIGKQMGVSGERIRQLREAALVYLRMPIISMRLRNLCEQDSRQAYRQACRLNNTWLRSRRRQP